jgi:hypothetical protein
MIIQQLEHSHAEFVLFFITLQRRVCFAGIFPPTVFTPDSVKEGRFCIKKQATLQM